MKAEHDNLKTLSSRLNYAIQLIGTKKADLARSINVKPQIIQFLCTSDTKSSRFTFEIATALGLNTRWLATGEGEMFMADPKKRAFKSYKKIPLLSQDDLQAVFVLKRQLDETLVKKWLPLETDGDDYFAITMPDTSMEPLIPSGSSLFIKKYDNATQNEMKIIFAYLSKFDTFVVRELIKIDSDILLAPKNTDLFKEVIFDSNVQTLGVITDCHWHIRSRN